MKSYLTEADTTATSVPNPPTRSLFRQPFRLLQNFQQCQDSLRSKMAASSSALKSITNRQKRTDSSVPPIKSNKVLDTGTQSTKNKASSVSSRQKNILNSRTNTKSAAVLGQKKQDASVDSKSKISDPSGSNTNSVGSLTSSPKWSHIKNKFENGPTIDKTKLSRTTSLTNEDSETGKMQSSSSKSLNSLLPETKLSVSKTRNLGARNDVVKSINVSQLKTEKCLITSKIKLHDGKSRSDNTECKTVAIKDKTLKPNSPKNSYLNIPKNSASNFKSSNLPKNSQLNIPIVKSSQNLSNASKNSLHKSLAISSISLSSNSSKNSEIDDANSISSTNSCNSSNNSQLNIPSACAANPKINNSPKSSLSNIPLSSSPKNSHSNILTTNISALHNGLAAKRTIQPNKSVSKPNQKHEDKPKSTAKQPSVNQNDQNRPVRKSFLSEKDRLLLNNISNINKTFKMSNSSNKQNSTSIPLTDSAVNKKLIADNVEKIQDLVKCSQPSAKTVWIKDCGGNWTKRTDTESKTSAQFKVASLRSKFLESSKETVIPLAKSETTNNVPTSRPLAKSSTTSSICDKTFIDDVSRNIDEGIQKRTPGSGNQVTDANMVKSNKPLKRNSVDSDAKLNIVQRAILSFEGNIALLSPETQRRLKLVNEKVRAQTDDDKILQAKVQNDELKTKNSTLLDSTCKKPQGNQERFSDQKKVGEPILPTREFLNRYQLMNKDLKKSSVSSIKVSSENEIEQKTVSVSNNNGTENVFKTKMFKVLGNNSSNSNVSEQTASFAGKNRQNLILNLSGNQLCLKSSDSQDSNSILQPNSSFLWRRPTATSSELSKSSTTSSVSLTSSDYRNYYDVQNYYSTLDLEIEKGSEISEEPIYIDSQESNSSENNYASSSGPYENIHSREHFKNQKLDSYEEWTDISDDDYIKSSVSSNQSSTLRRKRNKRLSSHRDSLQNPPKSQDPSEIKKKLMSDTISFTDSSDTLINDEIENESTFELSNSNHFYEPVYESLGNYLRNQNGQQEDDNCSISLSPDDRDNGDSSHCSLTSLESAESTKQEKEDSHAPSKNADKNIDDKKPSNKISQLKRHLSWTKNDIRLELSSKFNKIKIKKNGQNSTEIGVKVQEHGSVNTSPKKKTFIKCILRQKSSSSIPVKRSPSPKKESSLFYVHLSMGHEKQRPFSDSVIANDASKTFEESALQKSKKQSEPSLQFNTKCGQQQRPRFRKVASGPTIQRPKTPPPLPPMTLAANNNKTTSSKGSESLVNGKDSNDHSLADDGFGDVDSHFYTCLDPSFFQSSAEHDSTYYENDVFPPSFKDKNNRDSNFSSKEEIMKSSVSVSSSQNYPTSMSRRTSDDFNLSAFTTFQTELLKSPFEEEPMYQFYQKDVQQRATLWYSADASESEFEDDASSKFSDTDYQPVAKPPVLQSQMSAMDLVHGEAGQRTLWCEVPEVIESGILKTISSKERKIQEAMFEVITSEASYLKSLNFLIEHFVQCSEFSGSEKNILDKREKHILFSDIQPVRDVSAQLLADLEKRWLENIVLGNICDIIYNHASKYFSVYVKYCSNQLYQERLLRELKEKRPEFISVVKRLESNSVCQGLDMHSFLMLPMQRITRLPLLIDAIFHRLSADSPIYESCKMALATVNKIVAECNEGARKMERMEEMLVISQQLDFRDCKGLGLLSASRWLVKKGELVQLLLDNSSRRTFGRSSRWCKIQLYLFLFTDLLVVTRKKSDDSYSVVDFCPRNMLQVLSVDENMPPLPMRLPSSYRNLFQIIMLNNKEGKTVEMLLSCLLESDRTRWMDAMTPAKSENPDEKIYEEWDWPQFQCTHAYNAQQPDELSLEETDVVNVFRKMADGWFEGERIRDGVRGWFPSSHAVEIITSHVRARNLRQRYRLLMLSQTYLEEQYKAQALQAKK